MSKQKIAYIIPTKDRYADLNNLLESMMAQSIKPDQIIIVDASLNYQQNVAENFPRLNIIQVRASAAGTVKQKNEGVKYLSKEINLVGYLDDDIVLEADATERMVDFFAQDSGGIGGASFNIKNYTKVTVNLFTKLFMINNGEKGRILPSGYNVTFYPIEKDLLVEWLSAGATVWRREIIDNYSFDEYFAGYGLYEEVDYSYRVGRRYKMIVLKDAMVEHRLKPIQNQGCYALSVMDVLNRYYLVKKFPEKFSVLLFYWTTLGLLCGYFILGVIRLDIARLYRSWGYLSALGKIMTGNFRYEAKIR